jgi:osmotically-inducible protein OsmY
MTIVRNVLLPASLGVALAASAGCGGDVDRLASAGRLAGGKLEAATSNARVRLARGWESLQGGPETGSLQDRVAARLRLDQGLAGARIDLVIEGATVTLKGVVPDTARRRRAVELAQTTVGVEKVTDELREKE